MVLVVLDTVRADHTSLCGYSRPTTPTLEALAERGSCTCGAVSPGAWTLPSHASYFTGKPVLEHQADFAEGGGFRTSQLAAAIRPLDGRWPTLAEQLQRRGYQTFGVSANPVLSLGSGLQRGFDRFLSCRPGPKCPGSPMNRRVLGLLDEARTDRPLFLFVNYIDAHWNWSAVHAGVEWVPPTPAFGALESPALANQFLSGSLRGQHARSFLQRRRDLYDWGVFLADQSLGQLLGELERRGWFSAGYRLVVASDHGELLGEHGLLDHGRSLHEANNRVPVCIVDTRGPQTPLGSSVSALVVHDLVLGEPPGAYPIESVAFPRTDASGPAGNELWTAQWEGSVKTMQHGAVVESYDVDADPGELHPTTPASDRSGRQRVGELARQASELYRREGGTSPELLEDLRALGYVK